MIYQQSSKSYLKAAKCHQSRSAQVSHLSPQPAGLQSWFHPLFTSEKVGSYLVKLGRSTISRSKRHCTRTRFESVSRNRMLWPLTKVGKHRQRSLVTHTVSSLVMSRPSLGGSEFSICSRFLGKGKGPAGWEGESFR